MGLSRNKVAVPEGVAGTPPFWSFTDNPTLACFTSHCRYAPVLSSNPIQQSTMLRSCRGRQAPSRSGKFLENIERDNEVKKTKIVCNFKNSRFFSSCNIRDCNFKSNEEAFYLFECLLCNDSQIREREQERTEDALASGDEEGRGKLRKAPGICKQDLIR